MLDEVDDLDYLEYLLGSFCLKRLCSFLFHFCFKRFKQFSFHNEMGASQSSEPSHEVVPDPDPEEVEEEPDELEDPIDDFLESSIRWMFGVS